MANGMNDEKPGTNFPGFSYGASIATAFLGLLTDQAEAINEAWRAVKDGNYGVSDYLRNAAQMWESYYNAMSDAVVGPLRPDTPAWVYFLYSRRDKNALKRTVRLSNRADPNCQIERTALHALRGEAYVEYNSITAQFPAGNLRRDQMEIIIDKESVERLSGDGEYIGFVYDSHASGGPPLVVILLKVSG